MSLNLETVADGLGFPEDLWRWPNGSLLFVDIKNGDAFAAGSRRTGRSGGPDSGRTKRRGDRA